MVGMASNIGLDPKKIIEFFTNKFKDYIAEQQQKAEPGQTIVVVSMVENDELMFLPCSADSEDKLTPITTKILNVSKVIRETDFKKALKLMELYSDDPNKPDFFTLLEMAKLEN